MRITSDIYELLPDDSILKAVDADELAALLEFGVTRRFSPRQTVFEEGDDGDSMMIVLSGRLKVSVMSIGGKETLLDYIDKGNIAGEVAMLDGGPRAATVSAVERTDVMILHRRDLLPWLAQHTDAALKIIQTLCGRLRTTNALVQDQATLAMAPRLAKGLLRMLDSHGDREPDGSVKLRMSQSELGNYVALSRENVNRQLRLWSEEGLVVLTRGAIRVTNLEPLEDIADEWD
ncbi:MAG: Crp/Fnr family transcriptional regulator [Alphaproteobacteria bacterium]